MAGFKIAPETAHRIAQVWPHSTSLADAMQKAGVTNRDERAWRRYRRATEEMMGIQLNAHNPKHSPHSHLPHTTHHVLLDHPYTAVIFSDAHFWPNTTGPAFWILLEILNHVQPDIVIDNGDSLDGATISRHDPTMFEDLPTLEEEYEACVAHLDMISEAAGEAEKYRNIGNHDTRLESYLCKRAPAMKGMKGTTVGELFPDWQHQFSMSLANERCVVKHRWHGGIHAAYNNTLKAGVSMITGHTHRLTVREWTDFTGTRYGIETGTLADPFGPQFSYCEDTPRNWQPGFVLLEVDGDRVYPELIRVEGDRARWRGRLWRA